MKNQTEYMKEWRGKNKEKISIYHKTYKEKYPDKIKESKKKYKKKNPEKFKKYKKEYQAKRRLNKFNLSIDDYNILLKNQGSRCAICKKESARTLHIDHDHVTGRIRGLLCVSCNLALGYFKDNSNNLKSATTYLNQSQGVK